MNELEVGKEYVDNYLKENGNHYKVLEVRTQYKIDWAHKDVIEWVDADKCENDKLYIEPIVEITIEQIAKKFNLKTENIRIKEW